jgi:hypothetical protein
MSNLINSVAWQKIKNALNDDRNELVEKLIDKESPEVRGQIKQIDDVLDRYPESILAIKEDE